jgi:hypothetical protein
MYSSEGHYNNKIHKETLAKNCNILVEILNFRYSY